MSQFTDQKKSEEFAYQYMLNQYRKTGNTKMAKKFKKYPILTSDDAYKRYFSVSLRDIAMHDLGIGTTHNMDSVITGIILPSLRCRVYTPMERINIWRSKSFISSSPVESDCFYFNAFDSASSLDIPVYFFGGRYDYTCCYSLQKEYYEYLEAPSKAFYTFENSAHSPLFEDPTKAIEILKKDVLSANGN